MTYRAKNPVRGVSGNPCCVPGCTTVTLNRRYKCCQNCWQTWVVSKFGRARVKLRELREDPELTWLYELILMAEREAYAANRDRDRTISYEKLAEADVLDELTALFGGEWGGRRKTSMTIIYSRGDKNGIENNRDKEEAI